MPLGLLIGIGIVLFVLFVIFVIVETEWNDNYEKMYVKFYVIPTNEYYDSYIKASIAYNEISTRPKELLGVKADGTMKSIAFSCIYPPYYS